MKKFILFFLLFVSFETFAQTSNFPQARTGFLYKAGVQGRTGYTLYAIGTLVIIAPTLSSDMDSGIKTPMAVIGGMLMFTGFVYELSAWSNVKKAGHRNLSLKTTNEGLTLAYKF